MNGRSVTMKFFGKVVLVAFLFFCLFPCVEDYTVQAVYDEDARVSDWSDDGAMKVLSIGNSFSIDCHRYLRQIFKSLGVKKIKIGTLYVNGCSLERHYMNLLSNVPEYDYYLNTTGKWNIKENYSIEKAILSDDWDYIVIQQASRLSGVIDSYDVLDDFVLRIKRLAPNAKIVWNMTWAYEDDAELKSFQRYNNNQMIMYEAIAYCMKTKIDNTSNIDMVIPTGTVVQNVRTSYIESPLTRDGYHLSLVYGRYLAGLTFAKYLTGYSIDFIQFKPKSLKLYKKNIAIEAINATVESPYNVTVSSYVIPKLTGMEQIAFGVFNKKYYDSSNSKGKHMDLLKYNKKDKTIFATQIFTKEMLPVGSVVIVKEGWSIRAEGWIDGQRNRKSERETVKKVRYIVIDEQWWSDYTERAFNVTYNGKTNKNTDGVIQIYIPNGTGIEIIRPSAILK